MPDCSHAGETPWDALGGEQSWALSNRLGLGGWWRHPRALKGILGEHHGLNKGLEAGPGEACSLITGGGFDGFLEKCGIIPGSFHCLL